ncbi:transcription repressor NadR [Marinilactibacillus piezotolerans]|uniref:transcription repressor NadR n=1 Tax=Marinilactibacillus piezotolerans TaxID=258723 RepID=UPI0009AF9910|nr:transcription repressor NadR [Marinilactibacillus piezotolerans]
MDANKRRKQILLSLASSTEPKIARKLADQFSVSRQIIVGDIALLRAEGHEILSTPKGYVMREPLVGQVKKRIVCQHSFDQTLEELYCIVDHGGAVIDVIVEHPVYGEMIGGLNISNRVEADTFMQQIKEHQTSLLAALTNGLHSHTITAKDSDTLEAIITDLKEKNLLYH